MKPVWVMTRPARARPSSVGGGEQIADSLSDHADLLQVHAGLRLVEEAERGALQGELHDLEALGLAAGESDVDVAFAEVAQAEGVLGGAEPVGRADGVGELGDGHPGERGGTLESQTDTGLGAFLDLHVGDVHTPQRGGAGGDVCGVHGDCPELSLVRGPGQVERAAAPGSFCGGASPLILLLLASDLNGPER